MSFSLSIKVDIPKNTMSDCLSELRDHWSTWKFCYENDAPFVELPILVNPVLFQGFVYEFSVGRGLQLHQVQAVRRELTRLHFDGCDDAMPGMRAVYGAIRKGVASAPRKVRNGVATGKGKPPDQWMRISLASKLLSLWRPQTYPMWDRFARRGLEVLHGHARGHHYTHTDMETYGRFERDWRDVLQLLAPTLAQSLSASEKSATGFRERYFDLVLMRLGGRD